jgi:hypothetical protein
MDIGTGLALLGGAKVAEKILGPTAEYFGGQLKAWTAKRVENAKAIFLKAQTKLGSGIEEPGAVPPRIAHQVIDIGSMCDDQIQQEYFAGVLAGSRTRDGKDDRGVSYLALLSRLSSAQVRAHYIIYATLRRQIVRVTRPLGPKRVSIVVNSHSLATWVEAGQFLQAMGDHGQDPNSVAEHVLEALAREDAAGRPVGFGPQHVLLALGYSELPAHPGVAFFPTVMGVHLFTWAHGIRLRSVDDFLDPSVQIPDLAGIPIPSNTFAVGFSTRREARWA